MKPKPLGIHKLISETTISPAKEWPLIELIMREDVFHSTLDWQTREQLVDGAKTAFQLLEENRAIYLLEHACRIMMFKKLQAEASVDQNRTPATQERLKTAAIEYETAHCKLVSHLEANNP